MQLQNTRTMGRLVGFSRSSTPAALLTPATLALAAGMLVSHVGLAAAQADATDAGAGAAAAAEAKPAAAAVATNATASQLLEDFNFYVNIANVELAKANAEALLAKMSDPKAFLAVVEESATMETRFDEAYRRAILVPDLESAAAQLRALYDEGRRLRSRDPGEIDRNIAFLNGNSRARLLAASRLKEAREYAVPQLLGTLTDAKDPSLRAGAQLLLTDMGRDAVLPLCAALPNLPPASQEMVARVLGGIPYRVSLPFLYELRSTSQSTPVQQACEAAIARITGSAYDPATPIAELYRELGEQFYARTPSLITFTGERHQLVWTFVKGVGLNPVAVLSEVYPQGMAMLMTEKCLSLDPANQEAISLWLASNFSRQLAQPEGYENPLYPTAASGDASAATVVRRDPMYYAVAAGTGPVQNVLARAIKTSDTRLARKAIEALDMNTGSASDSTFSGGSPLVQAMSYPDRRVQFEAAQAIASASPANAFEGSERVVPILANAIRDAASRYAVVISREPTQQQEIRAALEGDGYTVLAPGADLASVSDAITQGPGVDMIVVHLPPDASAETIDQVRASTRLRSSPVLAMMSLADISRISSRFESDALTRLAREGLDGKQIAESARQLGEKASGPRVTEDEGKAYALSALSRLNDLATSGNQVLNVADAASPLVTALDATKGEVRMQVANVLARIKQQRTQVALFDAADASEGAERVALLGITADSAKRFGNMLEDRQIKRLVELAADGADDQATAAAALMGSLNLSNERLVPLITGK